MLKKIFFNNIKWLPVLLAGCTFTSIGLACQNHIYNNSHSNWTIEYDTNSGPFSGAAVMSGDNCPPDSTKCTLPPGGTIQVDYTSQVFTPQGIVKVTDSHQVVNHYNFGSNGRNCEYINHDGDTGAISVNAPDAGDISIWKDNWNQAKKAG